MFDMTAINNAFFNMYKMDYEFGWADKAYMKNLVVQGFLSADNYKVIVGEEYTASTQA